jgi:hypothetical protein
LIDAVKDRPDEASSAAAARLISSPARLAWERAFVAFACDELNGLFDRIAEAVAQGEPCPPPLKARLQPILEALSWDREIVIRQTWEIAKAPPDRPEDVFAPAMILSSLLPEDAQVANWVAACPPAVRQALAAAR